MKKLISYLPMTEKAGDLQAKLGQSIDINSGPQRERREIPTTLLLASSDANLRDPTLVSSDTGVGLIPMAGAFKEATSIMSPFNSAGERSSFPVDFNSKVLFPKLRRIT